MLFRAKPSPALPSFVAVFVLLCCCLGGLYFVKILRQGLARLFRLALDLWWPCLYCQLFFLLFLSKPLSVS